DERTLREVQRLRRSMADLQALYDLSAYAEVLRRSEVLKSQIEATGYKPLLAELLMLLGMTESNIDENPSKSETIMRAAMIAAERFRDDATSGKVAANLIYVSGYRLGRLPEGELWARVALAKLDRVGRGQERTRAWVFADLGSAKARGGDFETARQLFE